MHVIYRVEGFLLRGKLMPAAIICRGPKVIYLGAVQTILPILLFRKAIRVHTAVTKQDGR